MKKQYIKDIITFLLLILISVFAILNKNHNKTIILFLNIPGYLIILGIFPYVIFKITKGKFFIYKNPNKEKTLNNIDFKESSPITFDMIGDKYFLYSKDLPFLKNKFLRIFVFSFYIFIWDTLSSLWGYYVKLFRFLGIFHFLEKDFNKTINSHNYFPISINYMKNKKIKEK